MKTAPEIIEQLNLILKNELTAINQYFLHARMLKNWGFDALGDKIYHGYRRNETRRYDHQPHPHAGWPANVGLLSIGQDVPEMFTADLSVETLDQGCLKTAIALCEKRPIL